MTRCILSAFASRQAIARLFAVWTLVSVVSHVAGQEAPKPIAQFSFQAGEPIYIPVTIHGSEFLFMLDSGANTHAFDTVLKPLLGPPVSIDDIGTAGPHVKMERFRTPDMKVGDLAVERDLNVVLVDLKPLRQLRGSELFGILGTPFMKDYVVQFDFDQGEVRFFRPLTAVEPPRERERFRRPREGDNRPTAAPPAPAAWGKAFPINVGTTKQRVAEIPFDIPGLGPVPFEIDTGFTAECMIQSKHFAKLKAAGKIQVQGKKKFVTAGGPTLAEFGTAPMFHVGPYQAKGVLFSEGTANLAGHALLARFLLTFDYPNQRVFLAPGAKYDSVDRDALRGMTFLRVDGRLLIGAISPKSPAEIAGVQENDELLAIGGKPVPTIPSAHARMRALAEKDVARLTLRRDGREVEVRINPAE